MNLDDFIITCFCLIDEMLPVVTKGKRLRERGPMPKLADSEVITMEVVGTYLGLSPRSRSRLTTFAAIIRIFFRHWPGRSQHLCATSRQFVGGQRAAVVLVAR